jgi:hypothetical protein
MTIFPNILIFAADHRKTADYSLPFIRVTDNEYSVLNIMNNEKLFKYKDILSEVSRMMYIYENIKTFGKVDYIGFCHYRNFFTDLKIKNKKQIKTSNKKFFNNILTPIE